MEPTYSLRKHTNNKYIGTVPAHWEVRKLGQLGRFYSSGIDKITRENDQIVKMVNYTDVYGNNSHTIDTKKSLMRVGTSPQKIVEHSLNLGDMLFTPSSETKEDIGWSAVVKEELKNTVFSYHLLRFRLSHHIDLMFKKYLCNNYNVMNQFTEYSKGTTRKILGMNSFKNTVVVLPPLEEQKKIACYLDHKNRLINKLIRIKKKQIELLKELKQAIINDAVTGKIDVSTGKPYPKYKDSGIEWLGMIPEGWKQIPLKWCIRMSSGEGKPSNEILSEKTGKYQYPVMGGNGLMGFTNEYNSTENQIVIGRVGALCGNIHLLNEKSWVTDNALRVLKVTGFDNGYLSYQLRTMNLNRLSNANAQPLITGSVVKSQVVACPSISEQSIIVSHIEKVSELFEVMIDYTLSQIMNLKELQTRLISDVVTGKLDVRNIEIPKYDEQSDIFEDEIIDY